MASLNVSTGKTNGHLLAQNPVIRRLQKVNEYGGTYVCTYKGITAKLVFFLIFTALGAGLCVFMKSTGFFGGEIVFDKPVFEGGEPVTIYANEVWFVVGAALLTFIAPLLAVFVRPTIPVTGTLFCASVGFLMTWLATTFAEQYLAPVLLALVITLILVFTMGFLYGMGIIKVTAKLKTFILTLLITVCLGSLLAFVGSLIPFTSAFVAQLAADPVLSIGGSVLMVVIGTLLLLVDFDTIRECVDNGLPKKYEWYASFGLAFSVIWLYLKVLDLVVKLLNAGKNNR